MDRYRWEINYSKLTEVTNLRVFWWLEFPANTYGSFVGAMKLVTAPWKCNASLIFFKSSTIFKYSQLLEVSLDFIQQKQRCIRKWSSNVNAGKTWTREEWVPNGSSSANSSIYNGCLYLCQCIVLTTQHIGNQCRAYWPCLLLLHHVNIDMKTR